MRPSPPRRGRAALAAVLALALLACGHNTSADFPLEVGFQPLEPVLAAALPPAPVAGDAHPEGLGTPVAAPGNGYFASHARGYLHQPLARIYQALHDPSASLLHNASAGPRLDGAPVVGEEPFPISFRVRYANSTGIPSMPSVKFDLTYRGGPLTGTDAAPLEVGERYQKTWGTSFIAVMSGSLVAREVEAGVTEVEMVAWLNAETQGQADCDGTLRDLFGDLQQVTAALP